MQMYVAHITYVQSQAYMFLQKNKTWRAKTTSLIESYTISVLKIFSLIYIISSQINVLYINNCIFAFIIRTILSYYSLVPNFNSLITILSSCLKSSDQHRKISSVVCIENVYIALSTKLILAIHRMLETIKTTQ